MQLLDGYHLGPLLGRGAYGEVYEANVGAETPVNIPRAGSLNELWTKGGMIYSPPFR